MGIGERRGTVETWHVTVSRSKLRSSSSSQLARININIRTVASAALDGDARARVDEITAVLASGSADVTEDEVTAWREQLKDADSIGTFFFMEPSS